MGIDPFLAIYFVIGLGISALIEAVVVLIEDTNKRTLDAPQVAIIVVLWPVLMFLAAVWWVLPKK